MSDQASAGLGQQEKLYAVLARLCQRLGVLSRTQAVKLPYLVDVIATKYLGRSVTSAKYEAWRYGVVSPDVWSMTRNAGFGVFDVKFEPYSEAGVAVSLKDDRVSALVGLLAEDEIAIVDAVADRFGVLRYDDLGALTKRMNPSIGGWGSNTEVGTGQAAFDHLDSSWQRLLQRLDSLDLSDRSLWVKVSGDAREFARATLAT